MAGSFVENINLLASKLPIIEESNEIFDEGVIPVLEEIAQLDLDTAIADLKKGNYLGNRKLDINLILNMVGVDEALLERNPDLAEAIWTDVNKAVHYDKATITFVDGVEIELPFMFDGSPVTVTTHGDLLAQFARLDYVYAKAQIDSIYQLTVGNSTDYTVTIDATPYTFTSGVVATRENIVAGIANMLNSASVPITALVTDNGTKINLVAKVPGNPFYATVSNNMAINTIQVNVIEGPVETAFLAKLQNTLAANFAEPVVGEIVRLYDITGLNSNVERIRLNAVRGSYKTQAPEYYWANTTSAFQTLSMRANDIIKLGAEIDNIILLTKSIEEIIEIQKRIPQLVDTYDNNNNPNGDETIYNNLSELVEVHSKLSELITVYNDIKVGGTNYVQSIGQNLQGSNTVGTVGSDLQLGVDSNINITGSNIDKVITVSDNITNVNTVAAANSKIDLIVDTVIPNLPEILLADDNALIATNKALEATNAAAIATAKNTEMKNVSVGTTITGIPGTPANVTYNSVTSKFTFVIPKGDKGEKGDAFQVNAIGPIANRSLYNSTNGGFSFLAIDESSIYFKMSNTPGDWSIGSPFGKGDKGDKGNTGNSIVNTVFTSTTDPSGLAGQSGATDTYTINYDNLETDTFIVKNGEDGLDNIIDTVIGVDTTWSSTKINNIKAELDLRIDSLDSTTVKLTGNQTIAGVKTFSSNIVGNITGNSATATRLQTARTINGVSFDGSADITVSDSTAVKLSGNQTINGTKSFSSTIEGNITGNAATATKLSTNRTNFRDSTESVVAGELMWKAYGNGHTIFDASQSTSPTWAAVNSTNPDVAWTATYPTLMGYNGSQTYGVRVDSSRYAEYAETVAVATNNTQIATTAYVTAKVASGQNFEPGTYSLIPNRSYSSTSRVDLTAFEYIITRSGTLTVSFTMYASTGGSSQARIYVNGAARGTARSAGTSPSTFTENIVVVIGDRLQLYAKSSGPGGEPFHTSISNFRIMSTQASMTALVQAI